VPGGIKAPQWPLRSTQHAHQSRQTIFPVLVDLLPDGFEVGDDVAIRRLRGRWGKGYRREGQKGETGRQRGAKISSVPLSPREIAADKPPVIRELGFQVRMAESKPVLRLGPLTAHRKATAGRKPIDDRA
jgi:hypothetical protein